jgi:hypothetical protein
MPVLRRRTLLTVGVTSAALLAVAGGTLALLRPATTAEGRLAPAGREVFGAVARAVLDGLLPPPPEQSAAVAALLDRLEAALQGLPPALQAEVGEMLTVLASPPGRLALTSLRSDWAQADIAELTAMLDALRRSSLAVRQQLFRALRDLVNAAWFADPAAWSSIGYPGPVRL